MSLHIKTLTNDTIVNVAQLLKEPVGATRIADVHLERLALDESSVATDVAARVRLTRVIEGILADGQMSGKIELECVRCLDLFTLEFAGEFEADFRPSVDVRTGVPLYVPEHEDIFVIDNNHELDLDELLRQTAIVSMPMQALCREDCAGIEQVELEDEEEAEDERMAVLRDLLENES